MDKNNKSSNVENLKKMVTQGVVSVFMEVQEDFQSYSSGIYVPSDPKCGKSPNHAVIVSGYNSNPTNGDMPYFILGNSYSTFWGEEGKIRIAMKSSNQNGTCGIANPDAVSLPILD